MVTADSTSGVARVPVLAWTTIWSLSPLWDGKFAWTMFERRLESVEGNEKLLL